MDLDSGSVVLDVLRSDWDILIEIQATCKLLSGVVLQYVKGHQDRDKPYAQLDLLGQLNVDADAQADKFQIEHGAHRPFVILSPLTRAHLLLTDGTITGKYSYALQYEATVKPIRDYIQTKNKWSPFTMRLINWEAHGQALQRTSKQRTHNVKMLHLRVQ